MNAIETNPFDTLVQIAGGYCLPRSLHAVADLGVADALGEEPRTTSELATAVGAHPESLGPRTHALGRSVNRVKRQDWDLCPGLGAQWHTAGDTAGRCWYTVRPLLAATS